MKTEKTLFSDPNKKFKPRNLQAARIIFPARGYHIAPIDRPETKAERELRQERERKAREAELRRKVEEAKAEEEREANALKAEAEQRKERASRQWLKKAHRREKRLKEKFRKISK